MHDRLTTVRCRLYHIGFTDVTEYLSHVELRKRVGATALLNGHVITTGDQGGRHAGADQARSARDEHSHDDRFTSSPLS